MAKMVVDPGKVSGKICIVIPTGGGKYKLIAKAGEYTTKNGKIIPVFASVRGLTEFDSLDAAINKGRELNCSEIKPIPIDFRHRKRNKFGHKELNRLFPGLGDMLKSSSGKQIAILPGKMTAKLVYGLAKWNKPRSTSTAPAAE